MAELCRTTEDVNEVINYIALADDQPNPPLQWDDIFNSIPSDTWHLFLQEKH